MIINESNFAFNLYVYINQYWRTIRDWERYREDHLEYGMECRNIFLEIMLCFGLNDEQVQDFIHIIKAINRHENASFSLFQRDFSRLVEYCAKLEEF